MKETYTPATALGTTSLASVTKQKLKTSPITITTTKQSERTIFATTTKEKLTFATTTKTTPITRTITSPVTSTSLKTSPVTSEIVTTKTYTPVSGGSIFGGTNNMIPRPKMGSDLPTLPFLSPKGFLSTSLRKPSKVGKMKTTYSPSLTAAGFGITMKKTPKGIQKKTFTGLEFRPMLPAKKDNKLNKLLGFGRRK
jgi:hypothetical protein